jgi:hypothetical protein
VDLLGGLQIFRKLPRPGVFLALLLLLGFRLAAQAAGAHVAGPAAVHSQVVSDEYTVKAAFLYNFVKFVDWPAEAFKRGDDPIRICTLGESPISHALDETVHGKTFAGRPLASIRISEPDQASDCQMVFVSSSEQKTLRSILPKMRNTGLLTVGEEDGFAEAGGMINLKLQDGKIHLEINVVAAERAQLRLSSKLLSLARIVK